MGRYRNVVVTGGSGRLGTHVIERLAKTCEVASLDVAPPKRAGIRHIAADITDLDALREAFAGVDAVVHLAAVPNPRTASPQACFRVNTVGTWSALQAAEDVGVRRVVVASSDAATGLHYNPKDWMPHYLPVDEDHPLRPSEVYSLTKEITESIARSFAVRGRLEVLAIRPGHIVFPPEYPELETRGSDVQNYHLWGWVAPEDVAQGFERALALEDGRYDCFFIGSDEGLNQRPTLELFEERFGCRPVFRKPEVYRDLPTAGIFDISHARDRLGYRPSVRLADLKALRVR